MKGGCGKKRGPGRGKDEEGGDGDCKNVFHRVVVIFNYLKGVPVSLLKHKIELDRKGGG